MNATGGGGWNRFENNDTHLRFLLAPLPDIIGGANHFGAWSSGWAGAPCLWDAIREVPWTSTSRDKAGIGHRVGLKSRRA